MLLEMARLITIQQAEIDRLKTLLPSIKTNKKKIDAQTRERRLSLITKMYRKQWAKALFENEYQIAILNQRLSATGLNAFQPDFESIQILKGFK